MYLLPNSKQCAIDYREGPDADRDPDELLAEIEAERKDYKSDRSLDIEEYWDDEE